MKLGLGTKDNPDHIAAEYIIAKVCNIRYTMGSSDAYAPGSSMTRFMFQHHF